MCMLMEINIKGTGKIIKSMDKVNKYGLLEDNMKDNGRKVICMGMVNCK